MASMLLATAVLLAIAVWIFSIRRSETAEQGTMNKGVHIALRTCLGYILITLGWDSFASVFILGIYLAYDFLATKRAQAIFSALGWLIPTILLTFLPELLAYVVCQFLL